MTVKQSENNPPKETQSSKYNDSYVDYYIASLKNQTGPLESEIIFLRHKVTDKNNLINSFLPKNHVHPFSISHKTDTNKVHHQVNIKHSVNLSNESNSVNGSEDVILMEEVGRSSIQQKNKMRVSTTNEINNDNATKDHSNTKKYSKNRTKQYSNKKKGEQEKLIKIMKKKRSPLPN